MRLHEGVGRGVGRLSPAESRGVWGPAGLVGISGPSRISQSTIRAAASSTMNQERVRSAGKTGRFSSSGGPRPVLDQREANLLG